MSKTKRDMTGLEYCTSHKKLPERLMYMPRNNSSTLYHRYGAAHDGWQDCSGAGGHANTARMHKICVRILR